MAEAPAQSPPATTRPANSSPQFSVGEIASSRAATWGVRPALIRAALHGKERLSMAEAEKLVTEFAKTDLTAKKKEG